MLKYETYLQSFNLMGFFGKKIKQDKKISISDSQKLDQGLKKTQKSFLGDIKQLFSSENQQNFIKEFENRLLTSDVGIETTELIINNAKQNLKKSASFEEWLDEIKSQMLQILKPVEKPLKLLEIKPNVILVVGVNGVGKTTTIGKIAKKFKTEGKKIVLAAGDTFRAAAVQQLQEWGKKNEVLVISQGANSDSASVIFDAVDSASAKKYDLVLADTAGRLHTQDNLMAELKKIVRVIKKQNQEFPNETLLVLDASTGQNTINQLKTFKEMINISGLVLTKMDGTAKGGMIFSLANQFKLPIRFIGVGEGVDNLLEFNAKNFVNALLQDN